MVCLPTKLAMECVSVCVCSYVYLHWIELICSVSKKMKKREKIFSDWVFFFCVVVAVVNDENWHFSCVIFTRLKNSAAEWWTCLNGVFHHPMRHSGMMSVDCVRTEFHFGGPDSPARDKQFLFFMADEPRVTTTTTFWYSIHYIFWTVNSFSHLKSTALP